jgi:hypothetical protein
MEVCVKIFVPALQLGDADLQNMDTFNRLFKLDKKIREIKGNLS